MNAIVSIICYKQKTLKDNKHPLMLRITKDGKRKYHSLGIAVHPQHWDFQKNKPKPNCPDRDLINKLILAKETEYQQQILELAATQKQYTAASLVENKQKKFQLKTSTLFGFQPTVPILVIMRLCQILKSTMTFTSIRHKEACLVSIIS